MRVNNFLLLCLILALALFSAGPIDAVPGNTPPTGVWITVFSPEKVLYSKENADRMIKTCKEAGIDHIYLQIYRSDKAYYDSDIADRTAYEKMLAETGEDPLNYILAQAKKNNIKVHAWINLLSLAQNRDAGILNTLGEKVLTKDRHGRTPLRKGDKDELDKYYIRENQLFLEPGNENVRDYLVSIAGEITKKYPGFDGLHLDYVRYPSAVPFIPGSRFDSHGISYGYGDINVENFKEATGLDIKTMKPSRENYKKWDDWRRSRVTSLVREISEHVRAISPGLEISCTIVPSIERTYLVTFQDWTRWLREGLINYVVAMNYTDDTELMELNSRSILLPQLKDRIYIGVGAYLLKDKPEAVKEQMDILRNISPGGIVIFSYDDVAESKELQNVIASPALPPSSNGSL